MRAQDHLMEFDRWYGYPFPQCKKKARDNLRAALEDLLPWAKDKEEERIKAYMTAEDPGFRTDSTMRALGGRLDARSKGRQEEEPIG